MTLIDAELLAEMGHLPVAALGMLLALGLGLWLTGWWGHRFWITVLTSFLAGVAGLRLGPGLGVTHPAIAGTLLAMAGGCLALSLIRVVLFAVYGLAAWQLMLQFGPAYAVPLVCVTAGGLFSVFFFRLCIILLTSAAGVVLLAYAGLALAGQAGWCEPRQLAEEMQLLLNGGAAAVFLVGVILQQRLARSLRRAELRRREEERARRRHLAELTYAADGTTGWLPLRKAG